MKAYISTANVPSQVIIPEKQLMKSAAEELHMARRSMVDQWVQKIVFHEKEK